MDILPLFQYNQKLRFSDIERALKVRSNKLTYHLRNLTKKGLLSKEGNYYLLSESSEQMIPYLSDRKAITPVILIKIGDEKSCFLYLRQKRPFKDKMGLPGGRQLLSESIPQATKRIMKEKFNVDVKFEQIHSVSLEHIIKNRKVIQTDIIIFVSVTTKEKIHFINIDKNKKKIIASDYYLIKNDSNKHINIKTLTTKEK